MNIHFPSENNRVYIVTFYSHFGAVRFKRLCDARGIAAKVMPVPRNLSSSCGTCVRCGQGGRSETVSEPGQQNGGNGTFDIGRFVPDTACIDEVEQVALVQEQGYDILYRAENS